jgi:molecular chaperone DnaK (HSP70)
LSDKPEGLPLVHEHSAKDVLFGITDVVKSALKMAKTVIEDFKGVEMVIMAGCTSRLSFVRDAVASVVSGAKFLTHDYLDEMLATVRGAGLSKDFADLVVLRPSYQTKL